jgi:acetyltransferase-like isoleucine patch superfamily enzyme
MLFAAARRLTRLRRRGACALIDPAAKLHPECRISNLRNDHESIVIGARTHVRGELLIFWDTGRIRLGDWCYVGDGSRLWSQASIEIGNYVLISHLVDIHDTNSHPIEWQTRRGDIERILGGKKYESSGAVEKAPVVIEDDVWIGFKASIFKGVRIGRGAIVAAGSVVTKDVPPFTVVAGNPARVIRQLTPA